MTFNNNRMINNLYHDRAYPAKEVSAKGTCAYTFPSLAAAEESGRSFMLMPKNNLIVIDFDRSEPAYKTEPYFIYLDWLKSREVAYFEWNSGRAGHRHLVVAFSTVALQTEAWHYLKSIKLPCRWNQYCRPPLAPHKHGLNVGLCDGVTLEDVERVLSVQSDGEFESPNHLLNNTVRVLRPAPPRALSQEMQAFLVSGAPAESDRSYFVTKVALALVNSGYSDTDGGAALANPKNGISAHILDKRRGTQEQARYGQFFMRKARVFAQKNPVQVVRSEEETEQNRKLLFFIQNRPWPGRTGSSDLSTLEAHLGCALRAGSKQYGLSAREQELESRLALKTCLKANRRLVEAGWLRRVKKGSGDEASVWVVGLPSHLEQEYHTTFQERDARECGRLARPVKSPVFRAFLSGGLRGLGQAAGRVMPYLEAGITSTGLLARKTGLSVWSVRRALKILSGVGMVKSTSEGFVLGREVPEFLEKSANRKLELISARHVRERDAWKAGRVARQIAEYRLCA